jgi:hypothetical protein
VKAIAICDGVEGSLAPAVALFECRGEGRYIMRASPLCGDPRLDYMNGTDDRDGMACQISYQIAGIAIIDARLYVTIR